MAFGFKQSSYDAVLFVENNRVVKEMLLSEFEAVLDGIVGEPDHAGETCHAVYLKIDTTLTILGAVFFTIEFDNDGAADKHWNLPLNQLVETAAFGIELNGVPVRVASSSQCQIPWHQGSLWEPDLSSTSNIFKVLDARIKQNKLGLVVETARKNAGVKPAQGLVNTPDNKNISMQAEEADSNDASRIQLAQTLKKLRLHISNLKTRHQQEINSLRSELVREKDQLIETINCINDEKQDLVDEAQGLSLQIEHLNVRLNEEKLNYEKQLSDTLNKQGVDLEQIRRQFRRDLQQKLIDQTTELRDKLEMREVELHYRQDKIELLTSELEELKSESMEEQQSETGMQFEQIAGAGIHFVVTLPGIGPLNIPASEMATYMKDAEAYLAGRLKLDRETYILWSQHASHPVCAATEEQDEQCEKPIELVLPNSFVAGVSDRCADHQCHSSKVANG